MRALLHRFEHEGYEAVRSESLGWRGGLRDARRAAADALLGDLAERREMIRYSESRSRGRPIGSGPTEATCKTLPGRLKGSGRRRDARNAEALMVIEALTPSDQGDLYWASPSRATG